MDSMSKADRLPVLISRVREWKRLHWIEEWYSWEAKHIRTHEPNVAFTCGAGETTEWQPDNRVHAESKQPARDLTDAFRGFMPWRDTKERLAASARNNARRAERRKDFVSRKKHRRECKACGEVNKLITVDVENWFGERIQTKREPDSCRRCKRDLGPHEVVRE